MSFPPHFMRATLSVGVLAALPLLDHAQSAGVSAELSGSAHPVVRSVTDSSSTHVLGSSAPSMIRPAVAGISVQVTDAGDATSTSHYQAKAADIQASADTYGDFTR